MSASCCPSKKKVVLEIDKKMVQENRCLNVDKFGAIASFLCAIHCFITGVAMSALSIAGFGFLGNKMTDLIFVICAITFGLMAVRHGYKHHRSYLPALLFVTGLTMVFISHFLLDHIHQAPTAHQHIEENHLCFSDILAVLGGITIMSFHLINAKLIKKAKKLTCCSGK